MNERRIVIQGPLVKQPIVSARLASAYVSAAEALWDAATCEDIAEMWDQGRRAASWVLAACERSEDALPKPEPQPAPTAGATGAQELFPAPLEHRDVG